jgi:hypothetical protein
MIRCGPLTWTMWAWAWEGHEAFHVRADRVSWVATMYQGGIVFQAGVGGLGDRVQAERARLVGQAVYGCAATYFLQGPFSKYRGCCGAGVTAWLGLISSAIGLGLSLWGQVAVSARRVG